MINNNLNINNLNTKETNIHHNDNGNHDNHDDNHDVNHDVNHNDNNDDNKNNFFLSILIPVYNYDCSKLVLQIFKQCNKANIKFEIILGNDCSKDKFVEIYKNLESKGLCKVIKPQQNLGAGAMRNFLAENSKGTHTLIMDSDTLPANDSFIENYIKYYDKNAVICGGFIYQDQKPSKEYMLRYKYGIKVEVKETSERAKQPYNHFISMCFMCPKNIMKDIGFSSKIGMGYEDAYFGYLLKQNNIEIIHIDNPVIHELKETSIEYIKTIEKYIDNLYKHKDELQNVVKLLKFYNSKSKSTKKLYSKLSKPLKPILTKQLTSKNPNLKLFALYKLLYLAGIDN